VSKARKQGSRKREKKYLVALFILTQYLVAKNTKQDKFTCSLAFVVHTIFVILFSFILSIHTKKVLHDHKNLDTP